MSSALKILLVTNLLFSFYNEIICLKDCDDVVNREFGEDGYKIATFSLPSNPDKIVISVELSIDPEDLEDMSRPGSIILFDSKSRTIRQILRGSSIKYKIRYPTGVDMIESIYLNDKRYCKNDFLKSSFATSKIIMDYNVTLDTSSDKLLISKETWLEDESGHLDLLTYYHPTTTTTTTISPLSSRLTDSRPSSRLSKESRWLDTFKFNQECGKKDSVIVHTIINGREIQPNEFPWLVALFDNKRKYFCGGTLVSDQHVISAAHCTIDKTVVNMELGKHRIDIFNETGAYFMQSKQVINHPEFTNKSGHADISLIITSRKITFTDKIRPICIWPFMTHDVGQIGTVAGWGIDISGGGTDTPMATDVDIVSNEDCLNSHDVFRDLTSETTFCAGGKNKGPCLGDSGSGFLVRKEDRWFLKGIISTSIGPHQNSCYVDKFSVYCDIGKYLGWLEKYMTK